MGAEAAKVAAAVQRFVRRIDKTTKCQKCQNFLELCLENIKSCPAKLFPAQDSAVTGCPMLLPLPLVVSWVQLGFGLLWLGLVSFRFAFLQQAAYKPQVSACNIFDTLTDGTAGWQVVQVVVLVVLVTFQVAKWKRLETLFPWPYTDTGRICIMR